METVFFKKCLYIHTYVYMYMYMYMYVIVYMYMYMYMPLYCVLQNPLGDEVGQRCLEVIGRHNNTLETLDIHDTGMTTPTINNVCILYMYTYVNIHIHSQKGATNLFEKLKQLQYNKYM